MSTLNDMGGGYALTMPVQPMGYGYPMQYGGGLGSLGGFGDGWLIILLLLLGGGMWGSFGMGGWGGMMGAGMMGMDWLYPWLNNSQNINGGFRDQNLHSSIDSLRENTNDGFRDIQLQQSIDGVRDAVGSGFSAVQLGQAGISKEICATGRDITGALRDGFSNAEIAANGRQMASLQQLFGVQTTQLQSANAIQAQLAQCCCDNRLATVQTQNVIQAEAAANRAAATGDTQRILDKLCQIEQDTLRAQLAAKDDTIAQLRNEALYNRGQADRIALGTQIVDSIYNRLATCPVDSRPVLGNVPIFTCQQRTCNGNGLPLAS